MSKEINLKNYEVEHKQDVSRGTGESDVDLVELKVKDKKVSLARKKPLHDEEVYSTKDNSEYHFKIHQLLKEKGYPVPTTWRYDKVTSQTFITDLTEKGQNLVIDVNNIHEENIDEIRKIKISNMDGLEEEIKGIARKGGQDNILIPEDCYFIIVNKETGKAKVILGDLGTIGIKAKLENQFEKSNLALPNDFNFTTANLTRAEEIIRELKIAINLDEGNN